MNGKSRIETSNLGHKFLSTPAVFLIIVLMGFCFSLHFAIFAFDINFQLYCKEFGFQECLKGPPKIQGNGFESHESIQQQQRINVLFF
jgi:hypothetical protein